MPNSASNNTIRDIKAIWTLIRTQHISFLLWNKSNPLEILETNSDCCGAFLCICLTCGLTSFPWISHTALMKWCLAVIASEWGLSVWVGPENKKKTERRRRASERRGDRKQESMQIETESMCLIQTWPRQKQRANLWTQNTKRRWLWGSAYLIHCVAGSYKSWELHRLEERLWDSPAALLHHPRRSGGLSHTSPSICGGRKEKWDVNLCFTFFPSLDWLKMSFFIIMQAYFPMRREALKFSLCDIEYKLLTSH